MKNLSMEEIQTAIAQYKKFKETICRFDNKEECVAYLSKETGLSCEECATAYEFCKNTNYSALTEGNATENKNGVKKVLFVILKPFADWEAAYLSSALYMLGRGKYEVKTVSLTNESVLSIGGFRVLPDYDINTIPDGYEALILVGGMSWRTEQAKKIKPIAEKCLNDGKVLGAICDASAYLGSIGFLNDAYHTSNDLNDLKQWAGKAYTGETKYIARQAVRDGNLITANGTAPLEFAKEVLFALNAAPERAIREWYDFHKLSGYTAAYPQVDRA